MLHSPQVRLHSAGPGPVTHSPPDTRYRQPFVQPSSAQQHNFPAARPTYQTDYGQTGKCLALSGTDRGRFGGGAVGSPDELPNTRPTIRCSRSRRTRDIHEARNNPCLAVQTSKRLSTSRQPTTAIQASHRAQQPHSVLARQHYTSAASRKTLPSQLSSQTPLSTPRRLSSRTRHCLGCCPRRAERRRGDGLCRPGRR